MLRAAKHCIFSSAGPLFCIPERYNQRPEAMKQSGSLHRCHTDVAGPTLSHGRHKQLHEARDKKEKEPLLSGAQQDKEHSHCTLPACLALGAEMKMKQQP